MPDESGERRAARRSGGWQEGIRDAGPYLGLGMQLALTMVFFTVGGYLLDRWLNTLPWLTIVGAVLGMTAVFVHLVRVSRSAQPSRGSRQTAGMGGPSVRKSEPLVSGMPDAELYQSPGPVPVRSEKNAPVEGSGYEGAGREDFTELEREFARLGTIQDGRLLVPAWDAISLIERARKERIPVLAINAFVQTDAGPRLIETLDLSAGSALREGWGEAARFIEDLRESDLRFEVVFRRAD